MLSNSESMDNKDWKGSTWVYFITLIQVSRSKKMTEERKKDLRDVVATATEDIDNFVYWLSERSDVYEDDSFASELSKVLDRIIHFRNVNLFTKLSNYFLPVYLNYLCLMPETVTKKDLLRFLEIMLLSYPLPRAVLKTIQPPLIEFMNVIVSIKKPSIQSEFVHLYQCLSYVYPDLHLYSALSQLSVAYLENEIALTVKKRFLSCWSLTYLPENPPNGEYFSEDDDTILINACYSNPLWVSRVPKAPLSFETCLGEWLSVRTDRDNTFFSSVIHFSKDNMPICNTT